MRDSFSARPPTRVLATDLDGTFIPLERNDRNRSDLRLLTQELRDHGVSLVFVTGRHFASVSKAIDEFQLPTPDWIICDVGTSIFERDESNEFQSIAAYETQLQNIVSAMPITALRQRLASIPGLQLQEPEKQGQFKLSFYTDATELRRLSIDIQTELDTVHAPYSIIHSVDPFNGKGLIDLLPAGASKAYALQWWSEHVGLNPDDIVFAGDSGNDLAALTAGHRAIVVANADRHVVRSAYDAHRLAGWRNRLYVAREPATSGVLEGCRWFELFDYRAPAVSRLGATPISHNRTYFRVWAPERESVSVEIVDSQSNQRPVALTKDEHGYFTGDVSGAAPHATYFYLLDGNVSRPDPASRYQPEGVHGPSEIFHPDAFPWTDVNWHGVLKRNLIIYELHLGAFTQEGTFRSAIERIPDLLDLGVTAVELMPVAQSPGKWNWGYDGVNLFAVRNTYGEPDDFKAFVDACHGNGLAVLLDVVYNHLGPEGNYLRDFGPYFSVEHGTPWGEALNFDGPDAAPVRQFFIDNAISWLDEYHLDGLRLDAVHFMHDNRDPHILAELRAAVSDYSLTTDRAIHLIAEANVYDPTLLESAGDAAYDGTWCDCLMHSIYSCALPDLQLSHRAYRGADDLAEVLQHGFLYYLGEGDPERISSDTRKELSRQPGHPPLDSFVTALQTHDGVGNHPHGKRLHHLTSKEFQKVAAALTILYPSIPLLFMGEEWASDAVFPFFADFEDPELRRAVDAGRASEYPQHVWDGAVAPSDPQAFLSAKCDRTTAGDDDMLDWYRDLIELRKAGIADGWLCPSRMTVGHDATFDLFSLRFASDAAEVIVQARLSSADSQSTTLLKPIAGTILLSSEPLERDDDGRNWLGPNQAVITSRP